ncbi:hypothetical protein AH04_257 [Erwinia phage AH04]|uniref:Uncharacterized protein n=1 Tax=Erwinia phage AH04 TaxID=2869569 RepID=A0AAE7X0T4_9CAUD|nr:hypothetical protein PQC02_gp057 [Erwinia phage AH04]QZA70730.1 hypothetical protein AH04_257 [Erwinia phage AH04]
MFLDKLLNKIPYFRNRRIAKMKRDLVDIKNNFANGFFNDEFLVSLHNIVNSPLIAFTEDIVYGTMKDITLRTKSSVSAYTLLEKKVFKKTELERSPLISMSMNTGYFNEWYSNEASLLNFIAILKPYLAAQIWLNNNPEFELLEDVDLSEYGEIDVEMYDTLLYRLLLEDLVNIISFYLEIQYE